MLLRAFKHSNCQESSKSALLHGGPAQKPGAQSGLNCVYAV